MSWAGPTTGVIGVSASWHVRPYKGDVGGSKPCVIVSKDSVFSRLGYAVIDWIPVAESVLRLAGLEATAAKALVLIDIAFPLFGAGFHRLAVLAANDPLAATAAVSGLLRWCHRHGYLTRDNWRRRLPQVGGVAKPMLELAQAGITEHRALSNLLPVVKPPA
ncbi:hypothetical protein [Streptomyces sp. NPDC059371]|uniref:hypothetical protein n=1 Tax=Streptomyces sp. NPDC059371 TaxID=3346812 RepID=UPI00367BCD97